MKKQSTLLGKEFEPIIETKYTSKITTPIYEPKGDKPSIFELLHTEKYERLKREIEKSNLDTKEKQFLLLAATRHIVFNYQKIAEYYTGASKEMQQLMERSALVIVDFERAIEQGWVKLNYDITQQYLDEYEE